MKIPNGHLRLRDIRRRVEQNRDSVNPYPKTWSSQQVARANQRILDFTSGKGSVKIEPDLTLQQAAENQVAWRKSSRTLSNIAGISLLAGTVAAAASLVAAPLMAFGIIGIAGGLVTGKLAAKLDQVVKSTEDMKAWGALSYQPDEKGREWLLA